MDSVLTYLVDNNTDITTELSKSIKKKFNIENLYLINNIYRAFEVYLKSLPDKGEILISALAPYYFYEIILSEGFTPVVIDVTDERAIPDSETINNHCGDNTVLFANVIHFSGDPEHRVIDSVDTKILNIFLSGINQIDREEYATDRDSIISLESNAVLTSINGAIIICNQSEEIDQFLDLNPTFILSSFNSSFCLSQVSDIDHFFEKIDKLYEIFYESVLKSGYSTFEKGDSLFSGSFPVVLKKSLKDIQKYCKHNGVETTQAFHDSIIKQVKGVKASKARLLAVKTLLFPLDLTMKKEQVELISKILSTLP